MMCSWEGSEAVAVGSFSQFTHEHQNHGIFGKCVSATAIGRKEKMEQDMESRTMFKKKWNKVRMAPQNNEELMDGFMSCIRRICSLYREKQGSVPVIYSIHRWITDGIKANVEGIIPNLFEEKCKRICLWIKN